MNQQAQPPQAQQHKLSDRQSIVSAASALNAQGQFYAKSLEGLLQDCEAFQNALNQQAAKTAAAVSLLRMEEPPEIPAGLPDEHVGQWAQSWLQQNPEALKEDAELKATLKKAEATKKQDAKPTPEVAMPEEPKTKAEVPGAKK